AVGGELGLGEVVPSHVDLHPTGPVLQAEKPRLAEVAQGQDPAGHLYDRRGGQIGVGQRSETGLHRCACVVRAEVVRERARSRLPQGFALPSSDHDLLVVLGHASGFSKGSILYWLRCAGSRNRRHYGSNRTSAAAAVPPSIVVVTAMLPRSLPLGRPKP